jgi:hypothetical protein
MTTAAAASASDAVAAASAYSATRKKVLADCAEIVRRYYPTLPC